MSTPSLTITEHVGALASNLPTGRLWSPKLKPGTNLSLLLNGMAPTFSRMDQYIQTFVEESFPLTTTAYLHEWEEALGIPDDCFRVGTTIAERQLIIKIKLTLMGGVSTEQDFVDLAALFGLVVSVNSGIEHLPCGSGGEGTKLPAIALGSFTGGTVKAARFTMVVVETYPAEVVFPWTFENTGLTGLLFATDGQTILRCLIKKLAPANVAVQFVEAP